MFSPAAWARYQSAVQDSDSPTSSRGRQPKDCLRQRGRQRQRGRLLGVCRLPRGRQPGRPENLALNASTTSRTVQKDDGFRTKIDSARRAGRRLHQRLRERQDSPRAAPAHAARAGWHRDTSRTRAHRPRAPERNPGISRSCDQSPPPMTLPARTVAIGAPVGEKAVAETSRQQLGARFAVAVGIMAAQPVAFDEGPAFAVILVHLVAGHHEHALQMLEATGTPAAGYPCPTRWSHRSQADRDTTPAPALARPCG